MYSLYKGPGAADDALSARPGASDRDYDCKRH